MPTYTYACTACDHRFDVHQSFTDDALTICPECEGKLRKVFNSVGVVFKGSGFYRTDNAPKAPTSGKSASSSTSSSKSDSGSSSGDKAASSSPSTSGSNGSGSNSGSKAPASAAKA